jgi:hypothetical protein
MLGGEIPPSIVPPDLGVHEDPVKVEDNPIK